jgi:hypothetical protein
MPVSARRQGNRLTPIAQRGVFPWLVRPSSSLAQCTLLLAARANKVRDETYTLVFLLMSDKLDHVKSGGAAHAVVAAEKKKNHLNAAATCLPSVDRFIAMMKGEFLLLYVPLMLPYVDR